MGPRDGVDWVGSVSEQRNRMCRDTGTTRGVEAGDEVVRGMGGEEFRSRAAGEMIEEVFTG